MPEVYPEVNPNPALLELLSSLKNPQQQVNLQGGGAPALCLANAIEALQENLRQTQTSAEKYHWLRAAARETLIRPATAYSEYPDLRTKWELPVLVCSGPIGGYTTFDDAITILMTAAARATGVSDA